jgi:hypothetical protein
MGLGINLKLDCTAGTYNFYPSSKTCEAGTGSTLPLNQCVLPGSSSC